MKKIMSMLVFATIHLLASNVFAKEVTVQVPEDVTVEVLGEGPDQVVEIPFIVKRIHEVEPTPAHITDVTHVEGNNFLVRSGIGIRTFQDQATKSVAQMIAVLGELGYAHSPWRLQGGFDAGKCSNDTTAIGGSMALVYLLGQARVGLGADLLYCTDTDAQPDEVNTKRFISGFVSVGYQYGHFLMEAYAGNAVRTTPVRGGLDNERVGIGGLTFSVMF